MKTTPPLPTDCNAALYILRPVSDAHTNAAMLDNEALAIRTLEALADVGDGRASALVADQYMREMEKRGLT